MSDKKQNKIVGLSIDISTMAGLRGFIDKLSVGKVIGELIMHNPCIRVDSKHDFNNTRCGPIN